MTRLIRRMALAAGLAALVSAWGCSTIGDPGGMPDGLPHGGTGQFRNLDPEELEIRSPLTGRAMVLSDAAIESAAPYGLEHLFYAHAPLLDEPPELPMDHPVNDIYWPAFGPRTIYRGDARDEGIGGFARGTAPVLEASEDWEGGEVYDPWPVVDADGTARLYYAAAGGIGVAEASAIDGSFAKLPGPIVTEVDGAVARRPSVVLGNDGRWWMYFSAGDALYVARSDDGVAFDPPQGLIIEGPDETDSPELARVHPGAVRVETPGGRTLVRVYWESIREDGTHLLYVGATSDGRRFEVHARPSHETTDIRFPAPVLLDDRVTFLYATMPFTSGLYQTRAVIVAVSPAGERFDPPEAE